MQEIRMSAVPSCTQASCTSLTAACSTMFLTKNRLIALSCKYSKCHISSTICTVQNIIKL